MGLAQPEAHPRHTGPGFRATKDTNVAGSQRGLFIIWGFAFHKNPFK